MKRLWAAAELAEHWTIQPDELKLLGNKTGATRLGCAALLKAFQYEGKFPAGKHDVPGAVVAHLARQVQVPALAYLEYDWQGRSITYHRAQIREFLGVREATVADSEAVADWLITHILDQQQHPDQLKAVAHERFRALKLEPPTPDRLNRLIRSALRSHETRLYAATLARLRPETVVGLDLLLDTARAAEPALADGPSAAEPSALAALRAEPGPVGLASVEAEIAKLQQIRALGLPTDLFGHLAPGVLTKYRQRVGTEWPRELRAHPAPVRATLLAAFCTLRAREITDGLIDLLLHIVQRISFRAERRVEQELLADFRRVAGKHGLLFRIAEAALARPDDPVREVVYPVAGEQTLRDLLEGIQGHRPRLPRAHPYGDAGLRTSSTTGGCCRRSSPRWTSARTTPPISRSSGRSTCSGGTPAARRAPTARRRTCRSRGWSPAACANWSSTSARMGARG